VGGQFRAVAARRGYGVKAARSHDPQAREKRTKLFSVESRSDEVSPPTPARQKTVERRGRLDWHGDIRARRGVIRARV